MGTHSYIDHDLIDMDDENKDQSKYDDYSESHPSGKYIDHDLIDTDED